VCTYHEPVCVPCGVNMRCELNAVVVVDTLENGVEVQLWNGDKWKCPNCGHAVVLGFGQKTLDKVNSSYLYDNSYKRGQEETQLIKTRYVW